jgi:hypothetical protein
LFSRHLLEQLPGTLLGEDLDHGEADSGT